MSPYWSHQAPSFTLKEKTSNTLLKVKNFGQPAGQPDLITSQAYENWNNVKVAYCTFSNQAQFS